jgi:hypothetical protein
LRRLAFVIPGDERFRPAKRLHFNKGDRRIFTKRSVPIFPVPRTATDSVFELLTFIFGICLQTIDLFLAFLFPQRHFIRIKKMRNWERSFDVDKGFSIRHGYGMLFVELKRKEI